MSEPRQVGSPPWFARIIKRSLADARALLIQSIAVAADRPNGTARTSLYRYVRDHADSAFLAGVVQQSRADTERGLRAVNDLVSAIVTLMEAGGSSVVGSMVLARSAGESIVRFCHVHDPSSPPMRTLLRMMAVQVESVEDDLRTARAFGQLGSDDVDSAKESIAVAHAALATHNVLRVPDRRKPEFTANLTAEGLTENVTFNTTEAYRRYVPFSSWDWSMGSGAAHGRAAFLPNIVGTFEEPPMVDQRDVASTVTLQLLEVATAFARTLSGHTGVDTDSFEKKIHTQRIAVLDLDNPGHGQAMHHTEYGTKPA